MIRATAVVWLLLVLAASGGLYHIKHMVQGLEQELEELNRAVLREQEAIHVLKAEWSYLNRPEVLAELAAEHLDLGPIPAGRIATVDSLPLNLPALAATEPGAGVEGAAPAPLSSEAGRAALVQSTER